MGIPMDSSYPPLMESLRVAKRTKPPKKIFLGSRKPQGFYLPMGFSWVYFELFDWSGGCRVLPFVKIGSFLFAPHCGASRGGS